MLVALSPASIPYSLSFIKLKGAASSYLSIRVQVLLEYNRMLLRRFPGLRLNGHFVRDWATL
jgi:hypothetical protein